MIIELGKTYKDANGLKFRIYNPWGGVKVDTPIWVRDHSDDQWKPRHFAKHFNGKIYAWSNGATSHSSGSTIDEEMDDFVTHWEQTTLVNPNNAKGTNK